MTPLYKILISGSTVWAKMENQNPTGTHKDRSMERWILNFAKASARELAISSSGNSAISAAKYCRENNIKLNVFLSPSVDREKIERLRPYTNIILHLTKTPNKDAFRFCKKNNVPNLRASKDDMALEGYRDIARELTEQLPQIDNIFIPISSGATLEGMYQGYCMTTTPSPFFVRRGVDVPRFYAVQTTNVHPIASYFDKDFTEEKTSRATAIVDRVAHRRNRVIRIIKETRGGGFVISNAELEEA
ncbi:MAG: PLP-dependent lyase/thiolase, partial [Candidatus Spechtbacterales bacterium]